MPASPRKDPRSPNQCASCRRRVPAGGWGSVKNCANCAASRDLRGRRGGLPVERLLGGDAAYADAKAECCRLAKETGVPHEVDHVIPVCSQRWTDDEPMISGLHVPANFAVVSKAENRGRWSRFTVEDARAEEARLMALFAAVT